MIGTRHGGEASLPLLAVIVPSLVTFSRTECPRFLLEPQPAGE